MTRLSRDLRAGAIVGVTTLLNAAAYAAFLTGGSLAPLLPMVLASLLVATAVMSFVLARTYSLPSALGGPAGNAAAVVGAALGVAVAHDPTSLQRSADVAVVLALTALLPGIALLALGALRLGRAIRYFPYPVVAGFLAGTGWLVVVGAGRMVSQPAPIAVAVVFALGLRVVFARWKMPWAFPAAAVAAIVATWVGLLLTRTSVPIARDTGWLFGDLPAALPAILTPAVVRAAHWSQIGAAWGALVWVVIVVVTVSMLNGALLESETAVDERVDRDLIAVGGANVLVAIVGGFGSQVALPTSLAAHKLAPASRIPGYVVAAIALVGAFASSVVLPYLPRPVLAGIMAFYGLRFLEQYAVGAARTMARGETAIAFAMLGATAFLGLEPALFAGLVLACIAFISAASQFPVVRLSTTLREARSRVERTAHERALLDEFGAEVAIVRLQGHLFFGSAAAIDATLRPLIDREPPHVAIVLDFTIAGSVDVSAALGFAQLVRRARRRTVELVFAGLGAANERELQANGALGDERFATLDAALEAQEERLIGRATRRADPSGAAADGPATGFAAGLRPYVDVITLRDGERVFAEGEPADAMYVLVAGRLAVERAGVRLRTLLPGTLVGEMGFSTDAPRSADVSAAGDARLERLTRDAFSRLERDAPLLLRELQRAIVRLQADRLRSANAETVALHL